MQNYTHDCDACSYLGSGVCSSYGSAPLDFYVCGNGEDRPRSFIARYGNKPDEYFSGKLFACCELTTLDKIALFNGLTLTGVEERTLFSVLLRMERDSISRNEFVALSAGADLGLGNVMFPNDSAM